MPKERQTSSNGFRIRFTPEDTARLDTIKSTWGCLTDAAAIRQALALASELSPGDVTFKIPKRRSKETSRKLRASS